MGKILWRCVRGEFVHICTLPSSYHLILQRGKKNTPYDIYVDVDGDIIENVISDKFISFNVDPYKLLQKNGPNESDECLCMAQSLAPTYIKIGGLPIKDIILNQTIFKVESSDQYINRGIHSLSQTLSIRKWEKFVDWTKKLNIVPVITLDNADRLFNGNWNSLFAINVLTIADQSDLEECVWILNYECEQQSLKSYLDDLKSLKVILDAFRFGKNGNWKIASDEISKCSNERTSEEFVDFMTSSSSIVDVINFEIYSERIFENLEDSQKELIMGDLSVKNTHLWKNHFVSGESVEVKAFRWLQTLGEAAKYGYSSVFKTLDDKELDTQTLNYYISLIHKKFVGPEVLKLSMQLSDDEQQSISAYAHCAVLPNKRIENGVTLFAINSGEFDANVTFNVSVKENGGDIILFELHMKDGLTLLNGKEMKFNGDLQPLIIQIPSTEALRVSFPSKSIIFIVLTNTNIDICSNMEDGYRELVHKKAQNTADTLYSLLEENLENAFPRKTRSVDEKDLEAKLAKLIEKENDSDQDDLNAEKWKEILNTARTSRQYSNFNELFETLGQLITMIELENEFLEIGKNMLESNNTVRGDEIDILDGTTSQPLNRVIRNFDDAEVIDEDMEESEDSEESDSSKEPLIVQPDIEETKQTLEDLITKARAVLKDLNVTLDTNEEEIVAMGESEPLVKGIKDPELFLKKELLKSKIKLKQLKNKVKARVAEFDLKTKLKAQKHKLLKREVSDVKSSVPNTDKEHYFVSVKDINMEEVDEETNEIPRYRPNTRYFKDLDVPNQNSHDKIENFTVSVKKMDEDFDDFNETTNEKLTWSDLTETFGGSKKNEDVFTKVLNDLGDLFENFKEKLGNVWNAVTSLSV